MKNLRILVITGAVIAVATIIALMYVVATKNPAEQAATNNSSQNTNWSSEDADNNPETSDSAVKTYTDTINKYSFNYPGNLKLGKEDFTYVPTANDEKVVLQTQLVHEINTEYCAPSGECRPTTQDFEFGVSDINSSLAAIKTILGSDAKMQNFGTVQVLTMNQGVEGEGINYYFVSLSKNSTLMFDQRYIDEAVNPKYQTVKDFIPYAEQNQMMKDIISSLTITN